MPTKPLPAISVPCPQCGVKQEFQPPGALGVYGFRCGPCRAWDGWDAGRLHARAFVLRAKGWTLARIAMRLDVTRQRVLQLLQETARKGIKSNGAKS